MADIVASLARAEREGSLRERIRFLCRASLLIVDEIGYLPITSGNGNLFFQLVNARYERGAMILTSNRGFAEWGEVFGDTVVATALLDRLLHPARGGHAAAAAPPWPPTQGQARRAGGQLRKFTSALLRRIRAALTHARRGSAAAELQPRQRRSTDGAAEPRVWEGIESAVRHLAERDGRLYVVTGPAFIGADLRAIGPDGVLVPSFTWKAVYDPQTGGARQGYV